MDDRRVLVQFPAVAEIFVFISVSRLAPGSSHPTFYPMMGAGQTFPQLTQLENEAHSPFYIISNYRRNGAIPSFPIHLHGMALN
jgi:hypothetical protein